MLVDVEDAIKDPPTQLLVEVEDDVKDPPLQLLVKVEDDVRDPPHEAKSVSKIRVMKRLKNIFKVRPRYLSNLYKKKREDPRAVTTEENRCI